MPYWKLNAIFLVYHVSGSLSHDGNLRTTGDVSLGRLASVQVKPGLVWSSRLPNRLLSLLINDKSIEFSELGSGGHLM